MGWEKESAGRSRLMVKHHRSSSLGWPVDGVGAWAPASLQGSEVVTNGLSRGSQLRSSCDQKQANLSPIPKRD